jgi:sRNA-binding protein
MRILPRETIEELIVYLAATYPKAFFTQPQLKRPLKKNIIVDLERDRVLDDDKREAAVGFYTRDWNYEAALQAGAKRIDLTGKEVGTVTEQEQIDAEARVRAQKKELHEKRKAEGPIEVARKLHSAGRISTDQLSKITAPPLASPLKKATPMMVKAKSEVNPADPLLSVQTLLDAVRKALLEQPEALRRPFAAAGLRVVISECEKVIAGMSMSPNTFSNSSSDQPF